MLRRLLSKIKLHLRIFFTCHYSKVIRFYNYGQNNRIICPKKPSGKRLNIKIWGSNNTIIIDPDCSFFGSSTIFVSADNNLVKIGQKTTFDGKVLLVGGEGTKIILGEDCMFAAGVTIRTSDQHPIYTTQGERINPAQDISIGSHVWLGANSTVMKGVTIAEGTVVGFGAIVTKSLPARCIAVGFPAQPIKTDVKWKRTF